MQNDILLINPGIYSGTRAYGQMLHEPTMGLYVLGTYLSNQGFKVDILDGAYQPLDERQILKSAQASTVVGFYGVYTNMKTIFRLSELIKRQRPNSIILMGGPNWPAGKEILSAQPNIDAVVKDPAEDSLMKILLCQGKKIMPRTTPGVFLRCREKIIDTGNNFNVRVPSNLVSIKFEVSNIKKSILKLITAKGCPNSCSFCPSPKWQELSTIEDLVSAMEAAWHTGTDTFYIADENFCPHKFSDRIILMCNLIKDSNVIRNRKAYLKLFLEPQTPPAVLKYLSQIAYITVFVGFESFSDKTLAFLGKNTTRQKNLAFWNQAKKNEVNILPGIIALHPFSTPQELLYLIDILAMYDALSWRLLLKKLDLYPGTVLLSRMKLEFPELIKDDFSSFVRPSYWNYAYDQKLRKPILANIESAFKVLAEREEIRELYSLMFDLSFIVYKDAGTTLDEYHFMRSDFVNYTKKLAQKIVKIVTQSPYANFMKQLRPLVSEYLNVVNAIRKNCKKLFSTVTAEKMHSTANLPSNRN